MGRPALPWIPGYELYACLGGGTLTSVYGARREDSGAACAVKVLRPEWADQPLAIKLLQREARALLNVRHAHLVELIEAHVTRAPHYLAMPLLPGESLRRRLRRDYQLDVVTSLGVTRQVAGALAALHQRGFIHGDVKPDNIRLVGVGRAALLDLGFAHRPGENASFLREGYLLGTANYLAPELCATPPVDDPRGDLFSLGVTLFEMLTGRLPYADGAELDTLRRHAQEAPRDLCHDLPEAPRGLAEVINRLLSRDPKARPGAAELVHSLVALEIGALARGRAA